MNFSNEQWDLLSADQRLISVCTSTIETSKNIFFKESQGEHPYEKLLATFYNYYISFGIKYFFIDNKINKAKLNFYSAALCTDKIIKNFNRDVLSGQGLMRMFYTLLSDHPDLIKSFAALRHPQYEAQLKLGLMSPITICQSILIDDWDGFEIAMRIMQEKKIIEKFKMQLDWEYYNAVAKRDKGRVEEILHELLKPKEFNRRNKHEKLMREFIAYPVLGYAKLAWYKGIEVEIDHPLVPKELLPVKPLKNYDQAPVFPGADWE